MAVEHQRLAAAGATPGPEDVRTALLDFLPLDVQVHLVEYARHVLGHGVLLAGRAGDVDHRARRLDEAAPIDAGGFAAT